MDTIRIPNHATYSPVALSDLVIAAPLAAKILLRSSPAGRLVQGLALGAYAGSALSDWVKRRDVRRIDFKKAFGVDSRRPPAMDEQARHRDIARLAEKLRAEYRPMQVPRRELATRVDAVLTDYIAGVTGQRVETSAQVRDFMLAKLFFPFALGACDVFTGDVAIFKSTGPFEPHVIAHEFAHRKGYFRELDAQVLAYLALSSSGDPVLEQAAACERLHRQFRALATDDPRRFRALVIEHGPGPDLDEAFLAMSPIPSPFEEALGGAVKNLYELRMRVTGQGGLSDYSEGFTNFLHGMENQHGMENGAGG